MGLKIGEKVSFQKTIIETDIYNKASDIVIAIVSVKEIINEKNGIYKMVKVA